jgi:hypothetical protein
VKRVEYFLWIVKIYGYGGGKNNGSKRYLVLTQGGIWHSVSQKGIPFRDESLFKFLFSIPFSRFMPAIGESPWYHKYELFYNKVCIQRLAIKVLSLNITNLHPKLVLNDTINLQ